MKTLKQSYKINGYKYEKVKETELGYIYLQSDAGISIAYEVWKKRLAVGTGCFGSIEGEVREIKPKDKDFGNYAWTYKTLQDAIKRLNTL